MPKGLKLAGMIATMILTDVVVLSPNLAGRNLGVDHPWQTALSATIVVFTGIVSAQTVRMLYFKPADSKTVKKAKTNEDYLEALKSFKEIKVLKSDISFALGQVERMKKKKETLSKLLQERFEPTELTYAKFSGVIGEVEKLFYLNIRNIVNKISTFDEAEYNSVINKNTSQFSRKVLEERTEIYNDYINSVKKCVNSNEEVLVNLDKLVLEISRLDTFDDVEEMPAMQEIATLINQTKYYK